jgi:hypothetical protein
MKYAKCCLLCAIGLAGLLASSCTVDPPYTTVAESDLVKMPPFQVTVVRIEDGNVSKGGNLVGGNWIAGYFKTANGNRVCIGGPSGSAGLVAFIRSLSKGQKCTLPDAFLAFQKLHPGKRE